MKNPRLAGGFLFMRRKVNRDKIQKVELFVGVIILLGGLLTYGLGVHQLLPVPRPDLVVYGTTLIGIILIFMGWIQKKHFLLIEKNKKGSNGWGLENN